MNHGRSGPLALASGSALSSSGLLEDEHREWRDGQGDAHPHDGAHHQVPENVTNDEASVFSSSGESTHAAPRESEFQDDERTHEIEKLQKRTAMFVSNLEAEIETEAKADASERVPCGDFLKRDSAVHKFFLLPNVKAQPRRIADVDWKTGFVESLDVATGSAPWSSSPLVGTGELHIQSRLEGVYHRALSKIGGPKDKSFPTLSIHNFLGVFIRVEIDSPRS